MLQLLVYGYGPVYYYNLSKMLFDRQYSALNLIKG